MELFEYLSALTESKIPFNSKDDAMVKGYNPFIINRFISMNESFVLLANEINKYPDLSKETHYNFFYNSLPKRKLYFNYIKKEKDLTEEEVNYVANYFEITPNEARGHIRLLSEDDIESIVSKYKYGQTKSKKIQKSS